MSETTIDSVLARVRKLIERADHPATPETEADACRERAEKMMLDYAIEEAMLDASRPVEARAVPVKKHIILCSGGHPAAQQIADLCFAIVKHCRCEAVFHNLAGRLGKEIAQSATLVGYESDIRFAELLFTTLMLHLSSSLEPTPDPAKSFDENVYILHEAGVKWRRIADLLNRAYEEYSTNLTTINDEEVAPNWRKAVRPSKDAPSKLVPWPDGARLKNAYRRHCAEIGEEPRAIVSPVTYQRNFAAGYVNQIQLRLWKMRASQAGTGTALVRRQEAVADAFKIEYPDLQIQKPKELRYDYEARERGREAGDAADLSGGKNIAADKPALDA